MLYLARASDCEKTPSGGCNQILMEIALRDEELLAIALAGDREGDDEEEVRHWLMAYH